MVAGIVLRHSTAGSISAELVWPTRWLLLPGFASAARSTLAGIRDTQLFEVVQGCEGETSAQLLWLESRMKEAAPQALVVAR